jgi:low temperature requirement protein LtrA
VVVDYVGTILAGASGWRLNSAGHFAERHGLILIVAIGESIVAIGVGIASLPISWPIVVASVLGLTVAATLWWAYFDIVAIVAERVLRRSRGEERARLARDAYSYLHLPMVTGIVLLALGMKEVLALVSDASHHDLSDPLELIPRIGLFGGVALYLFGHAGFKYRSWHRFTFRRPIVGLLLLGLIPATAGMPALLALALLTLVMVAMIVSETVHYAELREQVRHEESLAGAHPSHRSSTRERRHAVESSEPASRSTKGS